MAGFAAYFAGQMLRPSIRPVSAELQGTPWQDPPSVASIVLTQADNTPFYFSDLSHPVNLVFFGFTRCPDVCSITMARLAEIYRNLDDKNLSVMLITVDPEFDTPELIQRYASSFHDAFIGLSGDNSQVASALQAFYIAGQEVSEGNFVHTDAVLILDQAANLRYVYGQSKLLYLEDDLRRLLSVQRW